MPLITKVRRKPEQAEELEKVTQRYGVRWKIKAKSPSTEWSESLDHFALVVEDPPRKVPVLFRYERYLVAKPWSYTIVHLTSSGSYLKGSIFFSYDRLKSQSERSLLYVPLTNITYTKLSYIAPCICIGRTNIGGTTLEDRATRFTEIFWSTRFNGEISVGYRSKPIWWDTGFTVERFMEEWESKSRKGEKITFRKASAHHSSINVAAKWLSRYTNNLH